MRTKLWVAILAGLLTGCPQSRQSDDGPAVLPAQSKAIAATYAPRALARAHRRITSEPIALVAPALAADAFHFDLVTTPVSLDWSPAQVAVGDWNGDRRPDVIMTMNSNGSIAPQGSNLLRIYSQRADGTLDAPIEFSIATALEPGSCLTLLDLDNDGRLEIAVGTVDGLTILAPSRKWKQTFYRGMTDARFLAAIDANGDGYMDVFAQSSSLGADLFLGDGQGAIASVKHLDTSPGQYAQASGPTFVEAADYTAAVPIDPPPVADGLNDIAMASGTHIWIYPFEPLAGLHWPVTYDLSIGNVQGSIGGMTVADIDRDGRPDLVLSTPGTDSTTERGIRVFYQGSEGGEVLLPELPYQKAGAVAAGDLDGNGYVDVVTMNNGSNEMTYFMQGPIGFSAGVTDQTNFGTANSSYGNDSFVIADVNSDGCPDVVLAEVSSSLRIFYGRNCRVAPKRTGGPLRPQASP